jgi:hypothetical protein
MIELIKQYKENEAELKKISEQLDKDKEKLQEEVYDIKYKEYDEKIEALKKERDDKIKKLKDSFDKEREQPSQEKKDELSEVIKKVGRVFMLFDVIKGDKDTNFKVYNFDYPRNEKGEIIRDEKQEITINPMEVLQDDKFKKIAVYVYENRKPKNKYSLAVIGRTIFSDKYLLYEVRNYGLDVREYGANIISVLKDMPTQQELLEWYKKNKANILKDYLEKHKVVEQEYSEALKLYEVKEWKILYLENNKEYYERNYHRGTEQEEYKAIVKELQELRK